MRPCLDNAQSAPLLGQKCYQRTSHPSFTEEPFLQGFLQIRAILDQDANANLQAVAVFLRIWEKTELLHKLELGAHFPGVVPQPPTQYQRKGLEREEITSTPPSTCGLAMGKKHPLYSISSLALWKSEVHPLNRHKM